MKRFPSTLAMALLGLALFACRNDPQAPAEGSGGSGGRGGGGAAGSGGIGFGLPDGSSTGVDGQPSGAGGAADAGVPVPVSCQVASPQCNDGIDNDGDGKIDSLDPECVGPCDNDEGSFATGIAGDNVDACKQDCFFDGNSGMGDDGCDWNLKCDSANPGGASCPYDASYKNCPKAQSAKCLRNCRKLTPNGCDCFGCCAVTVGAETINLRLVSSCTSAKFGDATACPRCTPNPDCVNTCEKCEVCIGRPAPDPSCAAGTGGTDAGSSTGQCPAGVTPCGPGTAVAATACGAGFYCQTGCCVSYTID
jgi:hypothetical protein